MKKCIVISDSFKGTLSSSQICEIARRSVPKIFPDCQVVTIPVADGGEGTVDCFSRFLPLEPVCLTVTGPLGKPVEARYGRMGKRAVIEMAQAAGLPLAEHPNPELATTFGVGQLIRHAVENGCTELYLGLGGSATNDGGTGCAAALGVQFYDSCGHSFVPAGCTLHQICSIDSSKARQLLKGVSVTVMCDVENPLCGEMGASRVFAPQKGADPAMVLRLEKGLVHLNEIWKKNLGYSVAEIPGSGAAGGMGGGCIAFLGASLKSGIEAVLDLVNFDRCLEGTDLVITGEGRIDSQSIDGKVISGIARRTKARQIPLVAIVGGIDPSADRAYDIGVSAMFGIDREAAAFPEFAAHSDVCYQKTLEDVLRLIAAAESFHRA